MRKQFTTTIDTEISDSFKKTCDSYSLKMNVFEPAFLKKFNDFVKRIDVRATFYTVSVVNTMTDAQKESH